MASRLATTLPRVGSWLLSCAVLGACSTDLEVDYRGRRRIAEGDFRVALPLLFGSDRYVLAAERDTPGLQLLHFDGSQGCDLGQAARAVAYWIADGLRIGMYDETEDGTLRVRFVDETCEPHLDPIEGIADASFSTGVVVAEMADGRLLALDPWNDRVRTVSKKVTRRGPWSRDALGNVTGAWLLEGTRLLRRDFEGEPIGDAIDDVERIASARESATELLYVDQDGTFLLSSDGATAERVAAPGCSPRLDRRAIWIAEQGERRVSLLSPCEDARLITVDIGDDEALRETVHAEGVASWWHRTVVTGDGGSLGLPDTWLFYRTDAESEGAPERVWVARPSDANATAIDADIGSGNPLWPWIGVPGTATDWSSGYGMWLLVNGDGVLGSWSERTGFEAIAEGVAQLGRAPLDSGGQLAWIVLHDAQDGLGTLSRISLQGTLETVAHDVPTDGLVDLGPGGEGAGVIRMTPPDFDGVLHEFDGDVGRIALLAPSLVPIADGVPPNAIREFAIQLRGGEIASEAEPIGAIAYLHEVDAERGVGTLAVRLADGREFEIDHDVQSFRPSNDPVEPGIVYAIGDGPRRGIWFARQ
jgi:hypothetical protein